MQLRNLIVWSCLVLVLIGPLYAHQDRVIELKNGRLLGLPSEYQPASLDSRRGILTIAGKQLQFSRYLTALFADPNREELGIASSWYHQGLASLPPYICFGITPKGKNFTYKVLVDMEHLAVLHVVLEIRDSEDSIHMEPIDPTVWNN